jgi:hypothetical protein
LIEDRVDRLELIGAELTAGRGLAEFEESVEALVRRLKPGRVAMLAAGSSGMPASPTDSRRRGWIEGALMIASHRGGARFDTVTHPAVKKEVGKKPTDKEFGDAAAALATIALVGQITRLRRRHCFVESA